MNRLRAIAILFLFALLVAAPAFAGGGTPARVVVNVPFDFVAGEITMPAGQYTIESTNPNTLKLTGSNGSVFVFVQELSPGSTVEQTKLVFHRNGNTYVLHQVWTEGHSNVHNLHHNGNIPDV